MTIFYMDMRTPGKEFDRYFERARHEYGVRFVRSPYPRGGAQGRKGDLRLHYINVYGQAGRGDR
jgi:heterodisulfide reductase subunit A2